MITDFKLKNVVAEMKRQLNEAAKVSESEARITFVIIHMISEHHELGEMASAPDDKHNLFSFICWCLNNFVEGFETPSTEDVMNPLEAYRTNYDINLLDLVRHRTPAKNAEEKGLDKSLEWPADVPYEDWEEELLQTAYTTLFGLYFFDTPVKDMMRWVGKDEPKNYRFVNAMNRHETAVNVSAERTRVHEADGMLPWEKKKKRVYIDDEEYEKSKEQVDVLEKVFKENFVNEMATGDTLRFCQEKEETAFGVFMSGLFSMMMPGEDVNRKAWVSSMDNAKTVYQIAKKTMMGKLAKQIVTADDDKAAAEVYYWGLMLGEQGVAQGMMPTGMADMDIRRKPGPKSKKA